MAVIVVLAAAVVVITGAALWSGIHPAPSEGYVRGRKWDPAHYEPQPSITVCSAYNSKGVCTMSVPVPQPDRFVPDAWFLRLEDCHVTADDHRRCRSGWRRVTEPEYERYLLGAHYPDPR